MFIDANWIAIFLGVISGIATTFLLWVFSILYKKVLLPYMEQMVYRGVNVSGDWLHSKKENIEIPKDTVEKIKTLPKEIVKDILEGGVAEPTGDLRITADFEITLNIKQKAHHLVGYFRAKHINNGKEYINYYKIKGVIKDNYVMFNYDAERNDRTGMGSFILRVAKGGTKLVGSAIFTPDASLDDTKIVTRESMDFEKK